MLSIDPILRGSSNDAADTANTAEPRRLYTFAIIRSSVKLAAVFTKKKPRRFRDCGFQGVCLTGRNQPDRNQNL
jgi:hypothetical protein